ncbi:MAG: COX15/CtaA family protein, partial [Acetobacteraceae bacterium]|nr:COX15/CtaA family protein [Acetobacteraceae bacterium]
WGRLTGFAVFLPLIWFWAKGWLTPALRSRLLLIFVLGALQGAVGWFMVASGFMPDTVSVSPYRLVIHLMLAVLIYGTIVWTALDSLPPPQPHPAPRGTGRPARAIAALCCAFVVLTMCAGGFVAGLHAGLVYNTFPLMDDRLVPAGYAQLHPFLLNLTENIAAVQFNHRVLATLTLGVALVTSAACLRTGPTSRARAWAAALGVAAVAQFVLGVLTLLYVVPVPLGVAHQAGAVLLLTTALGCLHEMRVAARREAAPSALTGWNRDRRSVIAR